MQPEPIILADATLQDRCGAALGAAGRVVYARLGRDVVSQIRAAGADVVVAHARPGSKDAFFAASTVRLVRGLSRVACVVVYPDAVAREVEAHRWGALSADAYVSEPVSAEGLLQALEAARAKRADPATLLRRRLFTLGSLVRLGGVALLLAAVFRRPAAPATPDATVLLQFGGWTLLFVGTGLELILTRGRLMRWWLMLLVDVVAILMLAWTQLAT